MSSYCRSRCPTISEKLPILHISIFNVSQNPNSEPCFIIDLISETRCINDGQRYAGALLIKLELCRLSAIYLQKAKFHLEYQPTVIGLILTPSSICALSGSSESLLCSTRFPHRVLTKVVRPVPDAPHTIKQNWIPFLTFFFRRILIYRSMRKSCQYGRRCRCRLTALRFEDMITDYVRLQVVAV